MTLKKLVCMLLSCAMLLSGAAAFAESPAGSNPVQVFYTEDGALSIQAPASDWYQLIDAGYWFAITNGTDLITINHLNPKDTLQAGVIADEKFGAVFHSFLSTHSDVFDVRGFAVNEYDLSAILKVIATIRFLKLGLVVYGEDATTAWIMPLEGVDNYTDSFGNTYTRLPDGLYRWDDTGMLYSAYPDYWGLNLGPETPDGKPFWVYGEDGTNVSIYLTVGGYYMDAKGNSYNRTKDGLFSNDSSGMLYSANPAYWPDRGPETPAGDSFAVYGEEGHRIWIYPVVGGYYLDSDGDAYDRTDEGLYRRHDGNAIYSADPDYWNNSEGPDTPAGGFFTVYGENGETVDIYLTVGGYYLDSGEKIYESTEDGLYRNHNTKMLYSADPGYWSEDRGPETQEGTEFRVYGEDGTRANIYPVAGGYFMDAKGDAYDLTDDGLYSHHTSGMLYSADPNYWNSPEEAVKELVQEEPTQDDKPQEEPVYDEPVYDEPAQYDEPQEEPVENDPPQDDNSEPVAENVD